MVIRVLLILVLFVICFSCSLYEKQHTKPRFLNTEFIPSLNELKVMKKSAIDEPAYYIQVKDTTTTYLLNRSENEVVNVSWIVEIEGDQFEAVENFLSSVGLYKIGSCSEDFKSRFVCEKRGSSKLFIVESDYLGNSKIMISFFINI